MSAVKVNLSRGALALESATSAPVTSGLLAPVNDLIGLRDDREYAAHLHDNYKSFSRDAWTREIAAKRRTRPAGEGDLPTDVEAAVLDQLTKTLRRWKRQGVPGVFLQAARQAEQGRLSAKLAPYLARIVRHPGDQPDEVPDGDLAALATWALDEALRLKPLQVRRCALCKLPWITDTSQRSHYCQRPAPGRRMTCRKAMKDEHFRERQRAWRLEYKRLHERRNRGTLGQYDWQAWRAANSPEEWLPFEEWSQQRDSDAEDKPSAPTRTRNRQAGRGEAAS